MGDFDSIFAFQKIMFFVVGGVFVAIFGYVIAMIFNPKLRGRMMSNNIKAMKHMTDFSKEDMQDMITQLSDVAINAKSNIINNNEEVLRDMASKEANINKDAIKTTFSAIREGLTGDNANMFCKHCGAVIDADSKFCKDCGKEQ